MAYITRTELRAHLGYRPEFVEDDAQIEAAVTAASALIDDWCGRTFAAPTGSDARVYASRRARSLAVDDVAEPTTALVETSADRVAWEAVDADGWFLDGTAGHPSTLLCRVSGTWTAWVRVTAEHGWARVPEPVIAATKLVASQLLSRRHSPNGIEVGGEFGAVRSSQFLDATAQLLLTPYRRPFAFVA